MKTRQVLDWRAVAQLSSIQAKAVYLEKLKAAPQSGWQNEIHQCR
jgi:hypothetical protein